MLEKLNDVWRKSKGSPNSIQPFILFIIYFYHVSVLIYSDKNGKNSDGADIGAAFDGHMNKWAWMLSNEHVMLMVWHCYEISIECQNENRFGMRIIWCFMTIMRQLLLLFLRNRQNRAFLLSEIIREVNGAFQCCMSCRCRCINIEDNSNNKYPMDATNPWKVKVWRKCWPDFCSKFA